jgi:hypothetical protein
MAATKKGPVLRVTGLAASQPDEELAAELKAAIDDELTDEEKAKIDIKVAVVPSCYNDEEKVALVECRGGLPAFLAELKADPLGESEMEMGDMDVNFDQHFFGFTQLYAPEHDAPVVAEYVLCCSYYSSRLLALLCYFCPAANCAQRDRHHRPRRPRVRLVARQRQPRAHVAARFPLQRPIVLPDDDLRLQLEAVEPRGGHDHGLRAGPAGGAEEGAEYTGGKQSHVPL